MRNFSRKILLMVNLTIGFLLVVSYLSVYISPETAWIFAFIGLAYPYIMILNLGFVLFWLIFRKVYFLFSLVIILAGWNSLAKLFQVDLKREDVVGREVGFKVISYNVRLFNFYQWEKDIDARQKMMDYLRKEDPSVICFQEFLTLPGGNITLSGLKKELPGLPNTHVHYTYRKPGKTHFGLATFSKYPIINKGSLKFENSLNGSIFSDVIILKDTVRIYNCHLQSVRLKHDYNEVLDSLIFNYDNRHLDEVKVISVKMRDAYIKRSMQADQLARHISGSPYPVIVCGDFNDTPFSYTYYKVRNHLKDAFIESGSGFGSTYHDDFPPIRIDYIFYSPSMESLLFRDDRKGGSDHYPVISEFTFVQKEDSSGQRSRP